MSIYLYELPTTGAISFSDFCVDQSPSKSYTTHISEATQCRANLRLSLKEAKRTDHGEKDYLKLVKIIDEYLPQLRGIMSCITHGEIGLKFEPTFSWRTTLSANLFHTSPRLSLSSLHAELASSLLTYAFALSNLARFVVTSLGAYEHDRVISDSERKAKDEKLNFAVTLLCKASGIFSHISDTILVEWENSRGIGTAEHNKPPDLSREVNIALAKMSLADAQSLAIRKLLSKSAYDYNIAPGPPLPKSHPSPALLAKLHLECASLYSSALSLVKSHSKNTGGKSKDGDGEVSVDLRRYLGDEAAFHGALARKWLGVDAGENGKSENGGEAVGYVTWAKKELEDLKDGGKGNAITMGTKGKEGKERRKEKVSDELDSVNAFLKHYRKINDSVHFRPVPSQKDLQTRIPAGRLAVVVKPFVQPAPAFGPGSVDFIRQRAEELELADGNGASVQTKSEDATSPRIGSYAGAGAYF